MSCMGTHDLGDPIWCGEWPNGEDGLDELWNRWNILKYGIYGIF